MRQVALLLAKDLRILRRSPVLLAVLMTYPLVIAGLVGLVAGYANAKPRVALVDRATIPARPTVAGHTFRVKNLIDEVSQERSQLVWMSKAEAARELQSGKVVATITIPPGFIADLQEMVHSPTLVLETTHGGIAPRVRQQMQALVYQLNRQLSRTYLKDATSATSQLILDGGSGDFLGRHFNVLGLDRTQSLLDGLPRGAKLERILRFVRTPRLGAPRRTTLSARDG